jgi:transcription termination factor Rho
MQRSVRVGSNASTLIENPACKIANIVLEKAKRLVECGHDVVILLINYTFEQSCTTPFSQLWKSIMEVWMPMLAKPKRFFELLVM